MREFTRWKNKRQHCQRPGSSEEGLPGARAQTSGEGSCLEAAVLHGGGWMGAIAGPESGAITGTMLLAHRVSRTKKSLLS